MKFSVLTVVLCCLFLAMHGQFTISDPLTRMGIGERMISGNSSMQAFGTPSVLALETQCFQLNNPASYSWMRETAFQASVNANQSQVFGEKTSDKYYGGQVGEIAMGFKKAGKPWGFAIGTSDYSRVGYAVDSPFSINDSTGGIKHQYGSGGIHQFTLGSSRMFSFLKDSAHYVSHHISVGANVNYLFGTLVHNRDLEFQNTNAYNSRFTKELRVNDIRWDIGMMYQFPILGNKRSVVKRGLLLGNIAINYSPRSSLNSYASDFGVNYYQYAGVDVTIDTGFSTLNEHRQLIIPSQFSYSFGLSYLPNNGGYLGLAYSATIQAWKDIDNTSIGWTELDNLNNLHIQTVSIDWSPQSPDRSKNFFGLMRYRAGATILSDYLNTGQDVIERRLYSAGVSMPIRSSKSSSSIQIGYQWSERSISGVSDLKVQRHMMMLGVQLHPFEKWFIQRKYD